MTTLQTPVTSGAAPMRAARVSREANLPLTIEVARVVLVIGLVFLHYFSYPNIRSITLSPPS
jgi:hypothetical protein